MVESAQGLRDILLRRQGLVFVEASDVRSPESYVRAVEIKLAELGYLPSAKLRDALGKISIPDLIELQAWMWRVLSETVGADQKHVPLFRKFPNDIPDDTYQLWVRKVLSHYMQAEGQTCLFCRRIGTTHVLQPCHHVVCDHCFDGANYSACPICEHEVDKSSPFFQPAPASTNRVPRETVTFKVIDCGDDIEQSARDLFLSFCHREQAMSPADREDLIQLLRGFDHQALAWMPDTIPVRENNAIVFGTLLQTLDAQSVLPIAHRHISTATDVLRLIAAYSNVDPALQGETVLKPETITVNYKVKIHPGGFIGKLGYLLGLDQREPILSDATREYIVHNSQRVNRFAVAPLKRPLRRALLEMLEGLPPDALVEDMQRHRSYWVWMGEFLHPHEYAKRYPNVARAFSIVRRKAPDGTPAPNFTGYYGQLDAAFRDKDADALVTLLQKRPGELARRFDHALRTVGDDSDAVERLLGIFTKSAADFSTPVLLTLRNFLPTRVARAPVRVFWPKGQTASGVAVPDRRPLLSQNVAAAAVNAVETELLSRFSALTPYDTWIIDEALSDIPAPFNERTASPAAVTLPRGASLNVPAGKVLRLFLHWCQPDAAGSTTDLDLSVGFYDADWRYTGVCSYYELKFSRGKGSDRDIAVSAGDRRDAPYPDGATEFIDLHRDRALRHGVRYAVMVVNAYAGLPFSRLERGFAGLMLRDDTEGRHFDPRVVELKFNLLGENGIYLPFLIDLEEDRLHWLDVYSKGQFIFNNVETSNRAITQICPDLLSYFGTGIRISLFELALLHAAARGKRVFLRGEDIELIERRTDEDAESFLARLAHRIDGVSDAALPGPDESSLFATLLNGDIEIGNENMCYALFNEKVTDTISASDLITGTK